MEEEDRLPEEKDLLWKRKVSKKKKQQKRDGSAEDEGTTRIPKKSLLKSVTW